MPTRMSSPASNAFHETPPPAWDSMHRTRREPNGRDRCARSDAGTPLLHRSRDSSASSATPCWRGAGSLPDMSRSSRPPAIISPFRSPARTCSAFADKDGEIRAFYNVCQHRAHELVQGSGNAGLIVCPYHAWTYELSGSLRGGPNIKAVPGFRPQCNLPDAGTRREFLRLPLRQSRSRCRADGRMVSRRQGGTGPPFVPDIEDLRPIEWVEIPENCNWKVSVRELFGMLSLQDQPPYLFQRRDHSAGDLRHPAAGLLPAAHDRVPEPRPHDLSDRSRCQ